MAQYYTSTTTFNLGVEAASYLENKDSRITQKTIAELGTDFWNNYEHYYSEYKRVGKLLFRAKVVNSTEVEIKQIWDSKESRDQFSVDINEALFDESEQGANLTRTFGYLNNETELNDWIDNILLEEDKILQYVCDDMKRSGMVIGDPLKGDDLITVT